MIMELSNWVLFSPIILGMEDCNLIPYDNCIHETESFYHPVTVRYTHTQAHILTYTHTLVD